MSSFFVRRRPAKKVRNPAAPPLRRLGASGFFPPHPQPTPGRRPKWQAAPTRKKSSPRMSVPSRRAADSTSIVARDPNRVVRPQVGAQQGGVYLCLRGMSGLQDFHRQQGRRNVVQRPVSPRPPLPLRAFVCASQAAPWAASPGFHSLPARTAPSRTETKTTPPSDSDIHLTCRYPRCQQNPAARKPDPVRFPVSKRGAK